MSTNPFTTFKVPFSFENGSVASVGGLHSRIPSFPEIEESVITGVRQIVLTEPQERVMLANFGVGAFKYIFSPLGSSIQGLLSFETKDQLEIWEPRADLVGLRSAVDITTSTLTIDLQMQLADFSQMSAMSVSIGF